MRQTGLYYYHARYYDPRISMFYGVDPLAEKYGFQSSYAYAANNPIRFIDFEGKGPQDRVGKSRRFVELNGFINYKQEGEYGKDFLGNNIRTYNRTGLQTRSITNLDCSEFVSRVMASDGITRRIQSLTTYELDKFFANDPRYNYFNNKENKWIKSDIPEAGDVFLWRTANSGHTGIVEGYDSESGDVTILHAKGSKFGVVRETMHISDFSNRNGWKGFFRPEIETQDGKIDPFKTTLESLWDNRPGFKSSGLEIEQWIRQMENLLE